MEIKEIRNRIVPILNTNGIGYAAVFGSVARGEARPDSDIDLLVELPRPFGLLKFIRLKRSLEEVLDAKVDLATPSSLNKFIKPAAMRDLKVIYDNG